MKIRRLLVLSILVVLGIFVLTQATYALRDETSDSPNSQKRASDVVDEGNDVLPSNAGIPLTASGYDLTDLTQELRILDDSLNTETTAEVTKLSAEFQISANQGTILDSVIALRSNLDKDENRERAIQHVASEAVDASTPRSINIVAFDADTILSAPVNVKRFKNDAREAQQAGKQVVIVAASPEAAEGIIENEELDDVKDVYVTILSGPAAKQWSQVPLTLGAYDFSVKNDITTKLLASKELIKGLVTAK